MLSATSIVIIPSHVVVAPSFFLTTAKKGETHPHTHCTVASTSISISFFPPPQKPTLLHRRVASSSRFPKTVLKYKPCAAFLFLFSFQKHHGKKNTSNDFWPTLDDLSVSRLLGSDNCFPFPFSFFPPPYTVTHRGNSERGHPHTGESRITHCLFPMTRPRHDTVSIYLREKRQLCTKMEVYYMFEKFLIWKCFPPPCNSCNSSRGGFNLSSSSLDVGLSFSYNCCCCCLFFFSLPFLFLLICFDLFCLHLRKSKKQ